MLISETFVNQTKGYQFGDSEPYEPFTDNIKRLFQSLQREYGRCVSKVRVDPDGEAIGWVFEKRMEYEDWRPSSRGDRYYVREVWVTLHDAPITVTRTPHYHKIAA